MCAARRPISTAGRRWAAAAGATTTCCPTSRSPSTTCRAATPRCAARAGRSRSRTTAPSCRSPIASSKPRNRRASRSIPISTASSAQGVGYSQMTRRGRLRGSTAQTFLREAKGRPNLRVETEAQGGKLLFEGKRCVGVTFQRGGNLTEVRANREVIVSGGTINSPHILQISGIGPAAHLQSLGIPGGARLGRSRRQPRRPLRDPRGASRARHADGERDRPLPARAARDPALCRHRPGRAHLRRHHRAGVSATAARGWPRPTCSSCSRRAARIR